MLGHPRAKWDLVEMQVVVLLSCACACKKDRCVLRMEI